MHALTTIFYSETSIHRWRSGLNASRLGMERKVRVLLKCFGTFRSPRLQWYFPDPKVAKLLRRHADREEKKREDDGNDPEINKKDKMLSHPKDASQWQALNFKHPEFGDDPRNIVLGASTDGVNPFGS